MTNSDCELESLKSATTSVTLVTRTKNESKTERLPGPNSILKKRRGRKPNSDREDYITKKNRKPHCVCAKTDQPSTGNFL